MNNFAVIKTDINSSELGQILSTHKTEGAAESALDKLGNVRGYYVAHRKADGEWESFLEARDRHEAVGRRELTLAERFRGLYSDTSALMSALDDAGIESDQDWDNGRTTWTFDDGSKIIVSGSEIEVD